MTAQPGRMDPEEFRSIGHELVDWVANYLANVENLPVMSDVLPGDVYRRLPQTAPEKPEAWSDIIGDLDEVIVPALTHWQSPNFFAYFPANNSGPSILGELVAAGLGVQGMLWATSPAATEVETLVLDWMERYRRRRYSGLRVIGRARVDHRLAPTGSQSWNHQR